MQIYLKLVPFPHNLFLHSEIIQSWQWNNRRRYDMTIQKTIEHFKQHQRTSLKKRTQEGYKKLLESFQSEFRDREVESIKAEELCRFLETFTEGLARATRRLRYAQLRALFNFVIDTFEMNIKNPCCVPQLFKSFKNIQQRPRKILDKETVDEIIFNSKNTRDRFASANTYYDNSIPMQSPVRFFVCKRSNFLLHIF
jgi:integrase